MMNDGFGYEICRDVMEDNDDADDGGYDILMSSLQWMMMGRGHCDTQHIPQ